MGDLLDPRAQPGAAGHDPGLGAGGAVSGQEERQRPGGCHAQHDEPGGRSQQAGEHRRPEADDRGRDERLAYAEAVVEQRVDVVDDAGEEVAAARAEPPGDEREEVGVDLRPPVGELAQHHVVAQHPLGVTQHRPRQAEEPYAHDGDHQVEHRWLLAGPGDQPAGRRREGDAGGGGQGTQEGGGAQPPARAGVGLVRDDGRAAGHLGVAADDIRGRRSDVVCRHPRGGGGRGGGGRRGGGEGDHPVRCGQHGRAVGHHEHEARAGQGSDGVEEHLLGLLVQVGAGLIQQHHRAGGQHDPGEGHAGALAGGEACPVLAEHGRETVGEVAHDVRQADAEQRLPHRCVVRAGPAQADVVGDGAGQQPRSLRCPGDLPAPPRRVHLVERGAADEHRPCQGRQLPAQGGEQRRLAAPGRSGDRDETTIREVQLERGRQRRPVLVADLQGDGGDSGRRRAHGAGAVPVHPRQERVGVRERRRALGGCVELRTDATQRPVGLRGEEQHDERDAEVDGS